MLHTLNLPGDGTLCEACYSRCLGKISVLDYEMKQLELVKIEWAGREELIHSWHYCKEPNEFHAILRLSNDHSHGKSK